jgi:hypothetical protein
MGLFFVQITGNDGNPARLLASFKVICERIEQLRQVAGSCA